MLHAREVMGQLRKRLVLRDLLSCTTLVQPSTVAIFQVLQRKTCFCVCVCGLCCCGTETPYLLCGHSDTFKYAWTAVTKDWQTREAGKVLAMSTLEPGRRASAQTLKATKHRSQTDRKAPQRTCLHMFFFTHTCYCMGRTVAGHCPFCHPQGKLMRPAAHSLMHTLQPQSHTQLAPSPTHKDNIQCDT